MGTIDRRLLTLERRTVRRPSRERHAMREALRRLSLAELEALEGAIVARETGRALNGPQEAAIAAWERVAPHDAA
jgi:hypothetical protein